MSFDITQYDSPRHRGADFRETQEYIRMYIFRNYRLQRPEPRISAEGSGDRHRLTLAHEMRDFCELLTPTIDTTVYSFNRTIRVGMVK